MTLIFFGKNADGDPLFPNECCFCPIDYGLKTVDVYDVTFSGYQGLSLKGWFLIGNRCDCTADSGCDVECADPTAAVSTL